MLKPKPKRTLIVVADGARARFFLPAEKASRLRSARLPDMVSPASRLHARDLKSDKPGRGFSARGDVRRSAFEPPHDYHKLEKHRFSLELAHALDRACERREFDQFVLVAPHRSLGELRKLLSGRVRKAVRCEVARDLTNETLPSLWRHLSLLVKPVL